MLRNILIITILLLGIIFCFGLNNRQNVLVPSEDETISPPVVFMIPDRIKKFNSINSKIKGLTCDSMQVNILDGETNISAHGYIRYEKDKKFRMIIKTLLGKELDLGSNESIFWFWGKRSDEKGLFFAKHEDYFKTRLKTPFNPIWIMHSLGVDEIDEKNGIFIENGIIQESKDALGREISTTYLIDENNRVKQIQTSDLEGKLLISVFYTEYQGEFPKEIMYHWHEENRAMKITFKNPREIGASNLKLWEIPDLHPQIDMSKD